MWNLCLSPTPKITGLLERELEIYGSNASYFILLGISLHKESRIDHYSDLSLFLNGQQLEHQADKFLSAIKMKLLKLKLSFVKDCK